MGDKPLDLREPYPSDAELMADGGRLFVTYALRGFSYKRYLESIHWQRVRAAALRRAGYRCFVCMERKPLDVHHTEEGYKHLGEEQDDHVVCLCREHHKLQHDILRHVMRARSHGELGQHPDR